jgi:DNA-binding winged helix-turn-helix (wHTH) protein/TolB-like protein/Tfp pilus assembly protein PilF
MRAENAAVYEFGGFRLDAAKRLLLRAGGEPVPLTPKVFETLLYLVRNGGKLVGKDELLAAVWTDTIVEENNLNQNISVLRKIFGEKRGEHRFIATVPGQGYKFVADVREIGPFAAAGDDARAVAADLPESSESELQSTIEPVSEIETLDTEFRAKPEPRAENAAPGNKKTYRRRLAAGLVAAVLLLIGLAGFYSRRRDAQPVFSENAPIKIIAVLPFKPLVAENRDESLEMGMADTLISKLGSGDAIVVRPLSSVRRFAALEQDSLAAGRELEADAVLDGSIQIAGERVRVSARLIRTSDGRQLWAGQFDEKFNDIFSVQDSIAEKATAALKTRLEKRPKAYTENLQAYQLYLKGRFHFLKVTRQGTEKAVAYFEQAIELDPSYALAYAGLADAYRGLAINGEMAPSEFLPKAKAAARKALELDESLSDAHAVLGFVIFWLDWNWNECERHYQRALELNPHNADALIYYANLHSNLGRHAEALALAKRARELDPLNIRTNALEAQFLLHAGQVDEALENLRKTLEMDGNHWLANVFAASAYIEKGMYREAVEHARRAGGIYDSPRADSFLCYALAKSGSEREARAELEKILKSAAEIYVSPYNVALIYNGLGEREETLRWLERGFREREPRMTFLKVEPKWNNLRAEPRFIELMKRMNF